MQKEKVEAEKTIAAIEEEAKKPSATPWHTSNLHWAKGVLALHMGDAKVAVTELGQCIQDDSYARLMLVKALEKAGDVTGAHVTRQKVIDNPLRDPWYLFVRGKLGSLPEPGVVPPTAAKEPAKPAARPKK